MKNLFKLFPVLGISLMASLFIGCSDDDDKSSEALILKMSFESPKVTEQPVIEEFNIKFHVAYNTTDEELKELVPIVNVSAKATVNPESGTKVDFSGEPVKFTVTAENGIKTVYTVTCVKEANIEALILDMTFENEIVTVQPAIDGTDIKFYVAYNATDEQLKTLIPTINISENATVNPSSGSPVDFSGEPVAFTVTAEDGKASTVYTVSCEKSENTEASIVKMTFEEAVVVEQPVIDGTNITFYVKGNASASNLKKLKPIVEISDNATISPETGSVVDFSANPVEFVVTAQDGTTTKTYTVTCIKSTDTESAVLSFSLEDPIMVKPPIIDGTSILLEVANGTTLNDLQNLVPTIEISNRATISMAIGSEMNFSKGAISFTVTAGDGKTKTEYQVMPIIFGQNKFGFEDWMVENPTSTLARQYSRPLFGGWSTCNSPLVLMMLLGQQVDRMSVTQTAEAYSGNSAARIETLGTKGGSSLYPKIVSGSMFIGKFVTDMNNTLNSTKFGVLYNKKPLAVKGYYKYTPGAEFHRCPDPSKYSQTVIETTTIDECAINAILYDVTDDEDYITGVNTYESDRIVAVATLADGTAKDKYTPFNIGLKYKKAFDSSRKYRLSIICSSSKWGDTFSGAPGSSLYIDDVEIISE